MLLLCHIGILANSKRTLLYPSGAMKFDAQQAVAEQYNYCPVSVSKISLLYKSNIFRVYTLVGRLPSSTQVHQLWRAHKPVAMGRVA